MKKWQSRKTIEPFYLAAWIVEDSSFDTVNFPIQVFQRKDQPDLFDVEVSGGRIGEKVGNYHAEGISGLDNAKAIAVSYAKQEIMRRAQDALAQLSAL